MIIQKISSFGLAMGLLWGNLTVREFVSAAPLTEIEERGNLIVAVKDNLRPLGFTDNQGNLQGLEIDIARKLAEELLGSADALTLQPVSNQERLRVLLEGEVDLTIAKVSATAARARLVNFSRYYYLDSTSFVTQNRDIEKLSDLAGKKIAVLNNSSTVAVLRHNLPTANLVGVDSYLEAFYLLEAGEAVAFAGDRTVLTGWVAQYPQYSLMPINLASQALCVVMPKGLQYADLWLRVDRAMASWQESGWLEERLSYWGLI